MRKHTFRKIIALLSACVLLASLPVFCAADVIYTDAEGEYVEKFVQNATIDRHGTLTIREHIIFQARGHEFSHGILRAIPVKYRTESGRNTTQKLTVLDASIDGDSTGLAKKMSGRNLVLRLGDADRILSRGTHTADITYTLTSAIGFFDTHDELYWNVIGPMWRVPVNHAVFSLSLQGYTAGEDFLRIDCYRGAYGNTTSRFTRILPGGKAETTRYLAPGECFTVAYAWPKGIIPPPPQGLIDSLLDRIYLTSPIWTKLLLDLGVAITAILALLMITRAARNHTGDVTSVPLFHEPVGMTPSLARQLLKNANDSISLSSEILKLAVAGRIVISGDSEKGFTLHRTSNVGADDLESALFADRSELHISRGNGETVRNAKNIISTRLFRKTGALKEYSSGRKEMIFIPALIGAAASFIIPAILDMPVSAVQTEGSFGLLFVIVCSIGVSSRKTAAKRGVFKILSSLLPLLLAGVAAYLTGALFLIPVEIGLISGSAILLQLFKKRETVWTSAGQKALADAYGLEMYISTAEASRLAMFNPPEVTPSLYEELLPYAVALECVEAWTSRFEENQPAATYTPAWYSGSVQRGNFIFTPAALAESFSTMASDFADSSHIPGTLPSSSSGSSFGGGGGGFAGGGSGGGGGGGW